MTSGQHELRRRRWADLPKPYALVRARPRRVGEYLGLVENGTSRVEIVCPDSAVARDAAQPLVDRLRTATGGQPGLSTLGWSTPDGGAARVPRGGPGTLGDYPMRGEAADAAGTAGTAGTDQDTVPGGVPDEAGRRVEVLLGNMATNPRIAALYHLYLCPVDADFPGVGGHYLRTVWDPWGDGTDYVIVGTSDESELGAAVRELVARLTTPGPGTVLLPHQHDVRISAAFHEAHPTVRFDSTDPAYNGFRQAAAEAYRTRTHRGMTPYLAHLAHMYQLTGDAGFAQLYLDLIQDQVEALAVWEADIWGRWGFDADFQALPMITGWHGIADSPLFTDTDREHITSLMVDYLGNNEEHWHLHRPEQPGRARQNHFTFAALGLLVGAATLGRCHDLDATENWVAMADDCFAPQLTALKTVEDCDSYSWLAQSHTLRYALLRPYPAYFTDGTCAAILDRGVGAMDNFGYQVPHGDAQSHRGNFSELGYWRPAAWLLDDAWLAHLVAVKQAAWSANRPSALGLDGVGYRYPTTDVDASEAADSEAADTETDVTKRFRGVQVQALDPTYCASHPEEPPVNGFDKISFRDGFDPTQPYVLLDGVGNGSHGHRDANAIVRFTSRNRIWLEDADYDKISANFHNTVLVSRDGVSARRPAYAELMATADVGTAALAETRLSDVTGAAWTRSTMLVRDVGLVVVDRVTVNEPGEYDIAALWRTVGTATLEEGCWRIDMGSQRLRIRTLPPAGQSRREVVTEHYVRSDWPDYPYAEPYVSVLRQSTTRWLETNESVVIAHLLVDGDADEADDGTSDVTARWSVTGWVEAQVGDRTVAFDPDRLGELGHADVLRLDTPPPSGEGERDGTVSGSSARTSAAVVAAAGFIGRADPGWTVAIDGAEAGSSGDLVGMAGAVGALTVIASHAGEADGTNPGAPGTDMLLVGTTTGEVRAYQGDQLRWVSPTTAGITALGGAGDTVVAGQDQGQLEVFDATGTRRWRREFSPHMGHPAIARVALVARLGSADAPGVLVATESCHVHAYTASGDALWHYEVVHAATAATAADVDGDGRDEVVAATEYWRWHVIDADGNQMVRVTGAEGSGADVVATCAAPELAGPGHRLCVFGGWDGHVHAYHPGGARAWDLPLGETISAAFPIRTEDPQADTEDLVISSRAGYLYRITADGAPRWYRRLDGAVHAACWLPQSRLVAAATGACVWWVDEHGTPREARSLDADVVGLWTYRHEGLEGVCVLLASGRIDWLRPRG